MKMSILVIVGPMNLYIFYFLFYFLDLSQPTAMKIKRINAISYFEQLLIQFKSLLKNLVQTTPLFTFSILPLSVLVAVINLFVQKFFQSKHSHCLFLFRIVQQNLFSLYFQEVEKQDYDLHSSTLACTKFSFREVFPQQLKRMYSRTKRFICRGNVRIMCAVQKQIQRWEFSNEYFPDNMFSPFKESQDRGCVALSHCSDDRDCN